MTAGGIDGYSNFLGDDSEYADWFGVVGQHRDSGELEQSNFATTLDALGGEGINVRVERYGHWGVGWIEEIYVRHDTPEAEKAQEIRNRLDNYPVLDDEDFSRREQESADDVWQNYYSDRDRVKYIREHASQFEFRSFADLLGCARGKYFNGYPSELLN